MNARLKATATALAVTFAMACGAGVNHTPSAQPARAPDALPPAAPNPASPPAPPPAPPVGREHARYRALADDRAKPEAWLEAAAWITSVEGGTRHTSFTTQGELIVIREAARGLDATMNGESLRARTSPGVTELLGRRMDTIAEAGDDRLVRACFMARRLAVWDPQGALPALARQMARARETYGRESADQSARIFPGEAVVECVTALTLARVSAGDRAALEEYGKWIRAIDIPSPRHVGEQGVVELVTPLWTYPDDPHIAAATAALFGEPAGKWVVLGGLALRDYLPFSLLLRSPLLRSPPFRDHVARALHDTSPAGSVVVRGKSTLEITLGSGPRVTATVATLDDAPADEKAHSFRVCDYYAAMLGTLDDAPRIRLYWPEARRTKAVAELRKALPSMAATTKDREELRRAGSFDFIR